MFEKIFVPNFVKTTHIPNANYSIMDKTFRNFCSEIAVFVLLMWITFKDALQNASSYCELFEIAETEMK